jgi:hypothetical protein
MMKKIICFLKSHDFELVEDDYVILRKCKRCGRIEYHCKNISKMVSDAGVSGKEMLRRIAND